MVDSDDSRDTLILQSDDDNSAAAAPEHPYITNKIILGSKPCCQIEETLCYANEKKDKSNFTPVEKRMHGKKFKFNIREKIKRKRIKENKKRRLNGCIMKGVTFSTDIQKYRIPAKFVCDKHLRKKQRRKRTQSYPTNAISETICDHCGKDFSNIAEFSSHVKAVMLSETGEKYAENKPVKGMQSTHHLFQDNNGTLTTKYSNVRFKSTIKENLKLRITMSRNQQIEHLSHQTNMTLSDSSVRPNILEHQTNMTLSDSSVRPNILQCDTKCLKDASTSIKRNKHIKHLKRKLNYYDIPSKKPRQVEKTPILGKDNGSIKIAEIYKCVCGLHFTTFQLVEKHFDVCNNNDEHIEYCCICDLPFDTESLVDHLCMHHSQDDCSFKIIDVQKPNNLLDDTENKHEKLPDELHFNVIGLDPCLLKQIKFVDDGILLNSTNEEKTEDENYEIIHKNRKEIGQQKLETKKCTEVSENNMLIVPAGNKEKKPKHFAFIKETCNKRTDFSTKEEQLGKINVNMLKFDIQFESDDEVNSFKELDEEIHKNKSIEYETDESKVSNKEDGIIINTFKDDEIKESAANTKHKIKFNCDKFKKKEKKIQKKDPFKDIHGVISNFLYKCASCNVHFVLKSNYQDHVVSTDDECSNKRFSCCICKLEFTQESDIITHLLIQHKELQLRKAEEFVVIRDLNTVKKSVKSLSDSISNIVMYPHITSLHSDKSLPNTFSDNKKLTGKSLRTEPSKTDNELKTNENSCKIEQKKTSKKENIKLKNQTENIISKKENSYIVQKNKTGTLKENDIKTKALKWISLKNLSVDYFGNMMTQFYGNILYRCQKCSLNFLRKDAIEKHYANCSENVEVTACPICGLRFAMGLNYHVYIHHAVMGLHSSEFSIKVIEIPLQVNEITSSETKPKTIKDNLDTKDDKHTGTSKQRKQANGINLLWKTSIQSESEKALQNKCVTLNYEAIINPLEENGGQPGNYKTIDNECLRMSNVNINNPVEITTKSEDDRSTKDKYVPMNNQLNVNFKRQDYVVCNICKNTILRSEIDLHMELHKQKNYNRHDSLAPNLRYIQTFENFVRKRQKKIDFLETNYQTSIHDKYLYKCNECFLHFITKTNLGCHISQGNHNELGFRCEKCNLKFALNDCYEHRLLHHERMNLRLQDFVIQTNSNQTQLVDDPNCSTNKDKTTDKYSKVMMESVDVKNKESNKGINKLVNNLIKDKTNKANNISSPTRIPVPEIFFNKTGMPLMENNSNKILHNPRNKVNFNESNEKGFNQRHGDFNTSNVNKQYNVFAFNKRPYRIEDIAKLDVSHSHAKNYTVTNKHKSIPYNFAVNNVRNKKTFQNTNYINGYNAQLNNNNNETFQTTNYKHGYNAPQTNNNKNKTFQNTNYVHGYNVQPNNINYKTFQNSNYINGYNAQPNNIMYPPWLVSPNMIMNSPFPTNPRNLYNHRNINNQNLDTFDHRRFVNNLQNLMSRTRNPEFDKNIHFHQFNHRNINFQNLDTFNHFGLENNLQNLMSRARNPEFYVNSLSNENTKITTTTQFNSNSHSQYNMSENYGENVNYCYQNTVPCNKNLQNRHFAYNHEQLQNSTDAFRNF